MSKLWRIGFLSLLVVTVGAQLTNLALQGSKPKSSRVETVAEFDSHNLQWHWAADGKECQKYDSCVFIAVEQTQLCADQLEINVHITDINDEWVANTDMVIDSPNSSKSAVIEVGANRDDFEYFMVGAVRCTTGLPSAEGDL